MRGLSLLALASTTLAWSRNPQHVNKRHLLEKARPATHLDTRSAPPTYGSSNGSYILPQNANTTRFAVDGAAIPDVDFDIGESYAGLLPISDKANASELYFWFVPSANELAGDEILIWLNGGPGCSSLEGFLQENGPFLWQYGTYKPVKNNWSWSNLTNVVWVEQPAGTGFSHVGSDGAPKNEVEVAAQFLGWFKNFVDTFALYVLATECIQGAADS
jgi:carboxypeptidase D